MVIAFAYGGQGSQVEGMGYDLYLEYPFIREFYDSIESDFPLKDLSFHGDLDLISKTQYTQSIMLAFQIAVTKVLKFHGIEANLVLGLSLGEYSGLYASGVLNEEALFKIISYRSRAMHDASKKIDSKMLAVFSDKVKDIDNLCKDISRNGRLVQISNINTRGQLVIAGESSLVSEIENRLVDAGYRTRELNTSGPFHTSYMDDVSIGLEEYFKDIEFKKAQIPIIHNLYGDFNQEEDIKKTMAKQANHPVLFKSSLEKLIGEKPDLIIEIGYKNTIKGLIRRIDKSVKTVSVNTTGSIRDLIKEVEASGQ